MHYYNYYSFNNFTTPQLYEHLTSKFKKYTHNDLQLISYLLIIIYSIFHSMKEEIRKNIK